MTTIAFFAHDENDAAVKRRVFAFEDAGCEVVGFAMRRSERAQTGWATIDLGRTHDARFAHRLGAILSGAGKAAAARAHLVRCDIVYARNLDMALCSLLALASTGVNRPLVYECLDIHRLMRRDDFIGAGLRGLERIVLDRSALLTVSSPAFIREYFDARHPGRFSAHLIENRIADAPGLAKRPLFKDRPSTPLRIGWFGVLRCRRSLDLLEALAIRFGAKIEIVLRGFPDLMLPDFHERIRHHHNMRYRGRYRSPEDLAEIYHSVDLVWAGDFHDAGFNSQWLLPNRIYEGGYFATPAIAPDGTETGRWIRDREAGFVVEEPLETALPALVERLLDAPGRITHAQQRLLSLPRATFVQPRNEMRDVIDAALALDVRKNGGLPVSRRAEAISSCY